MPDDWEFELAAKMAADVKHYRESAAMARESGLEALAVELDKVCRGIIEALKREGFDEEGKADPLPRES